MNLLGFIKYRWHIIFSVVLTITSFVMRLWDLGLRAMHHDESLHAYYSWILYSGNGYQHDPMMHGPFQIQATAGIFFIFGDSDYTARLLYVLAGTALVFIPFLLRNRLGICGYLIVSSMLAFSPTMLYFSRFARNDIIMAVWVFGLVVCMWGYLDTGKPRYIYAGSVLLAFAFCTKETAYMATIMLGMFLALVVVFRNWGEGFRDFEVYGMSTPVAITAFVTEVWRLVVSSTKSVVGSRAADFFIFLFVISLPLGAAFVGVFQDTALLNWTGFVLAAPAGTNAPIGSPVGGGLVMAFLVVLILALSSIYIGSKWNPGVFWRCASIFYSIFILLHTTFLTNFVAGLGSGFWRSLGYWTVQQGEARGGQPWYYYFVITSVYEFFPMIFALVGAIYYIKRKDHFGMFLVFWAVTTFGMYTVASEKMPWLLVNVTLPLIVLAGKFIGDVAMMVRWRSAVSNGYLVFFAGTFLIPLLLVLQTFVIYKTNGITGNISLAMYFLLIFGFLYMGYKLAKQIGYRGYIILITTIFAFILLAFSIRAGWYASYINGDIPVEMIVYTQTSPEVVRLLRHVEHEGDVRGGHKNVPIFIDITNGFTWPWAWYLRDYVNVKYGSFEVDQLSGINDPSVLIIHSQNRVKADQILSHGYSKGIRLRHRWWFPEVYRNLTIRKVIFGITNVDVLSRTVDYFVNRRIGSSLGSEDAIVYFSDSFPALTN